MTRVSKHACAAVGCLVQIPGKYLMCEAHWGRVPVELQVAINESWRMFQAAKAPAERQARLTEYQQARSAAIACLAGEAAA